MVLFDEFPGVGVGDVVRATKALDDEGTEVADPGDLGHVVGKYPGSFPTVFWDRTGRALDCAPSDEFAVVKTFRASPLRS